MNVDALDGLSPVDGRDAGDAGQVPADDADPAACRECGIVPCARKRASDGVLPADLDAGRAGGREDVVVEERGRRRVGQQEGDVGNAERQIVGDRTRCGLRRLAEDENAVA